MAIGNPVIQDIDQCVLQSKKQGNRWRVRCLRKGFDKMIKFESEKIVKKYRECKTGNENACIELKKKMTGNIIFFDIDDRTFLEWEEPVLTPRDKLADLIKIAASNSAKVIVLDILLYDKACNPDEDNKLIATLKSLSNKEINVLFPYTLSRNKKIKRSKIDGLDDLIDKSINFYIGLPIIMASEDGVIRYFSGYQVAKDKNDESKVLWDISVLATALFFDNFNELRDKEEMILNEEIKDHRLRINLSEEKKIYIKSDDIYTNRIRFFMRPPDLYGEDKKGNLSLAQRMVVDLLITNADNKNEEYIKGKIVIIGNSSLWKGDTYFTPVGYMKGMYIIGNSINTIIHNALQITPSQRLIYIFAEIPLILIIAFLFSFKKGTFNDWLFALIPIFILLLIYIFYSKEVFFKLLLVISVMLIYNKWKNNITTFFGTIFKKSKKLLWRKS